VQDAFHLGGWGMYPTTLFGLVLVAAAINYARQPAARRLAVIRHLDVLVLMSGTLGVVTGVIKTCIHVPSDQLHLVVVGFGESLHNVGLALCIMVLARIIVTLGAARDPSAPSELVDPRP
jgi:hypothetical protein